MSSSRRMCLFFRGLNRRRLMLLLVIVMGFLFYMAATNVDLGIVASVVAWSRRLKPWSSDVCIMAVDQRRRLAATIADVQREIHHLAGNKEVIDAKWSVKLAAVAAELDPRLNLSTKAWDFSARLPEMGKAPKGPAGSRHVCPEVYLGARHDWPHNQHGMEAENCTYTPKFKKVLSAILPAVSWEANAVNFVISQIRKLYDIPIIAIVSSQNNVKTQFKDVRIVRSTSNIEEATAVNEAVKLVRTPYTFLGLSITHFNNQSSLERLVRVLDELEHVKVAGGSARDLQGNWTHGCLQQRMANYQAYYIKGYYYSKYECMYCDDLLTPFVASTELLQDISFTVGVNGPALYRDWFANVRVNGHLTVSCPDVMFYVNNHPVMNEPDWLTVGKQWALERIHSYDGHTYTFPCSSVDISCKYPLSIIYSYLLPPCCKAIMERYIGYIADYGEKHNLTYELQAGSALAAVKMEGQLPWDFDADIAFMCKDYDKWVAIVDIFKDEKCSISVITAKRYFEIKCPHYFVDMICFGYNTTSQIYLPPEYRSTPTVAEYSGRYVRVSANPGLFSRNRMGLDDLKHAGHWRTLDASSEGNNNTEHYNPGVWNYCEYPKHHSCLIHYPGEGNLPFLQPFLHL